MKINSVDLTISAVRRSQYPTDNKPEFLMVGRSNVGKSSFINTLINRKNYARTSSKPGKTQTINFYLVNDEFYIVDAPGYGFANLSKSKKKKFGLMMEDYNIICFICQSNYFLAQLKTLPTYFISQSSLLPQLVGSRLVQAEVHTPLPEMLSVL